MFRLQQNNTLHWCNSNTVTHQSFMSLLLPSHSPRDVTGGTLTLRPPQVNWLSFLPKQFLIVINQADREWIAQILYDRTGQLKQKLTQNWYHPPSPTRSTSPPDPLHYFRQRMFLWAPMRMRGIPLKCTSCNRKMHHSFLHESERGDSC